MLTQIPITFLEQVERATDKPSLEKIKREYSKKSGLAQIISNTQIIVELRKNLETGSVAENESNRQLIKRLRKSAVRSMSGVCVVAVMLPPVSCPYKCAYCPTSKIAAKSYTGYEPAALRARQNNFDSFRQVSARLEQFENNGHLPEKCELIVMGGTFNTLTQEFQENFVKRAFDAFNEKECATLEEAHALNEQARHRVVALTFETRPDWANKREQVSGLMRLGATRIELGVQSLDDGVLARVKRGHGVKETAEATSTCKDAFLKVGYHLMPGLHSTPEKDEQMAKRVFAEEEFKPDMLKIYPALVIPGTELYEEWQRGEFEPYDEERAAEAVARMKRHVPEYCRIMRVDRDIPTHQIAAGVKKTNLRELVESKCAKLGVQCRCIRCREAGLKQHKRGAQIDFASAQLKVEEYASSGGKEFFLHFEDETNDALLAFLRLRRPSCFGMEKDSETAGGGKDDANAEKQETLTMGVRELRVYGEQTPVGDHSNALSAQHKSFGKTLMHQAEEIAGREGAQELLVTSGVGVRGYYSRLGYQRQGFYMAKKL